MRIRAAILGFCLAASPAWADPQKAAQLRDAGLKNDTAWSLLESLTSEIGPRPAGTPAAARARDWGVAKLIALGFANVHVEPFAKQAWLRDSEAAEILGPYPHRLAVLGLGNGVPTPAAGLSAPVVVFDSLAALKAAPLACCAGKIVLVNQPMIRTQSAEGYGNAVPARSAAALASAHGAVAYLVRSISTGTGRAPHTGAMQPWKAGERAIPAAALGVPDAELVAHLAARGPVTLRLNLQSHVSDTLAWNVSGEFPGSDPTAGTIVIGGHLDSWDPGTGAIDDGAGIAITMAAAKLVAGTPHRRTIRVVMWGSEETGGSAGAYLAAHKNELDGIVLAGESDLGADKVLGLALPAGAWDAADIAPLAQVLAPLQVLARRAPPANSGADLADVHAAGVPVFAMNQDASRYFDYHHSQDDTLSIVDPFQLRQNVAAWAASLSVLADTDFDFRKGGK